MTAANVRPARATGDLFVYAQSTKAAEPELAVAKDERGTCIFREHRRCTLHVVGGESVLPIGCRHYPRIFRRDDAQTTLTLSHYCPTAASLLINNGPLGVVDAAPPLDLSEPIDGLDARAELPPLLRPAMAMDATTYKAWEEAAVEVFASVSAGDALARVGAATDHLRRWTPASGSLSEAVVDAFAAAGDSTDAPAWTAGMLDVVRSLNKGAVSLDASADLDERWHAVAPDNDRVVRNYLAARVFGNWIAYQGRGLRSIVGWLSGCYDVLRLLACRAAEERGSRILVHDLVEAARQADYVMLHTVDSQAFANAVAPIETR